MPVSLLFASGPGARIPISTDISEQVRLLRKFRPDTLLAHPSNLDAITNHCRDNEIGILVLSPNMPGSVQNAAPVYREIGVSVPATLPQKP